MALSHRAGGRGPAARSALPPRPAAEGPDPAAAAGAEAGGGGVCGISTLDGKAVTLWASDASKAVSWLFWIFSLTRFLSRFKKKEKEKENALAAPPPPPQLQGIPA